MKVLANNHTEIQLSRFISDPSHALMISGEKGAGKFTIAKYIVASILNVSFDKLLLHPYTFMLDASQEKTGIDEVRKIQKFLSLVVPGQPTIKRAVIIEYLDILGHEAQNALLKTIEEPPADTIIVLTTSNQELVLSTIHSRAQQLKVQPVTLEQAFKYFAEEHKKEEINRAYHLSSGQVGLLSALLENNQAHPLLQAIDDAKAIITMTRYERLSYVDRLLKDKNKQPALVIDGLYRLIYAGYKQSLNAKSLASSDLKSYTSRLNMLDEAVNDLRENTQAKLVLSRLFLEF